MPRSIRNLIARAVAFLGCLSPVLAQDAPNWETLDARPTAQWFRDAKFGIFIHWGVYAVPAYCDTSTYSEWYQHWLDTNSHGGKVRQFHEKWYGKDFDYKDFAPQFRAELFDAAQWAKVFKRAGAQYIVITSKHHDGFCLWPNEQASAARGYPWNSAAVGPQRDLLAELSSAVRAEGVRFGLYYSFMEWHNPLFEKSIPDYVERVMFPQIRELIERYEPAVFWPDGEWNEPDATWRSREILQWIRDHAKNPDEIVVNDRWGKGARGVHGDFYTTEYGSYGGSETFAGKKPFEECRGIGHSFAFNRAEDYDIYQSRTACVRMLIDLVSKGGNLLLDIGPDADGTIPLIMVDRLLAIGRWLDAHGESIYGCEGSPLPQLDYGRATRKGDTVYVHVFDWPSDGALRVPIQSRVSSVTMVADRLHATLPMRRDPGGALVVDLAGRIPDEHATVIAVHLAEPLRVDTRVVADARGVVTLRPDRARIEGPNLRVESHTDADGITRENLGYWSSADARAVWPDVGLLRDTEYDVQLEYAVKPGSEGGALELRVGSSVLATRLSEATGGWSAYRVVAPWSFNTSERGRIDISVRATSIPGEALANLRSITFRPVAREIATPLLRAQIAARNLELCEALLRGDLAAVAAAYLDDAVLLGAGGQRVAGREAIDTYWERLRGVAKDWQLEMHDLQGSEDIAHQTGRSTMTLVRDGVEERSVVDFTLIWRKGADGVWRIAVDGFWR